MVFHPHHHHQATSCLVRLLAVSSTVYVCLSVRLPLRLHHFTTAYGPFCKCWLILLHRSYHHAVSECVTKKIRNVWQTEKCMNVIICSTNAIVCDVVCLLISNVYQHTKHTSAFLHAPLGTSRWSCVCVVSCYLCYIYILCCIPIAKVNFIEFAHVISICSTQIDITTWR